MSFLRCQVTLNSDSGLPEDVTVNTFHFDSDTPFDAAMGATIKGRIDTFYGAIDEYLGQGLSGQGTVAIYDLEDPEPRTPVYEAALAGFAPATSAMPSQVAVCLSYQADGESGEPQRRRRGRLYLGPLALGGTIGAMVGGDVTVLPGARTAIAAAASALASAADPKWAVFSRAEAGAPAGVDDAYTAAQLGPAFNDVTNGWVDDRHDIQRRRQHKPTVRTTWTD